MKILYCSTVDIHIKSFHLPLIHDLKVAGNTIDLVSNGNDTFSDIETKFNVTFSRNPLSLNNIKAYVELKKLLNENAYDVISTHTPIASFLIRMAARKHPEIKVIYMAHGFHFYKGASLVNKLIFKTMEKIAAHYTDVLITINKEDYASAQKFTLKKNGQVNYIPGVGLSDAKYQKVVKDAVEIRNGLGVSDDKVLVSIGELNHNKNHMFVIKALQPKFKENNNLKYLICGKGPLEEELQQYIIDHELEKNVKLLGYRTDIMEIVSICDLFIFSSRREGLPVSIIEAMIAGAPVLASNIRGNCDLIEDGRNGYLYDQTSVEDFLKKFSYFEQDHFECKTMREHNMNDAKKYSYENLRNDFLNIYKK